LPDKSETFSCGSFLRSQRNDDGNDEWAIHNGDDNDEWAVNNGDDNDGVMVGVPDLMSI